MSLHAARRWRNRSTVQASLLAAMTLFAIARLLHQYGMQQPTKVTRILERSSRLSETVRLAVSAFPPTRARRNSQEAHR